MTGGSSQSIDCSAAQKTLGVRIVIGMTSDAEVSRMLTGRNATLSINTVL